MPQRDVFKLLSLASSGKQTPQVVENTKKGNAEWAFGAEGALKGMLPNVGIRFDVCQIGDALKDLLQAHFFSSLVFLLRLF